MPIYEYECTQCGKIEEAWQKISDKPLCTCKHCSGSLKKLISQNSFHLKGTGWYVTDYAGKKAGSEKSSTTASTESKPVEKKETKKDTTA